jgi:pyruvate/2-oxoglutarate/acetoin dehydrogenase E1 component
VWCSASVVEESFYYLDAPVERICGADVPMPYAANLERLAVPQVWVGSVEMCEAGRGVFVRVGVDMWD